MSRSNATYDVARERAERLRESWESYVCDRVPAIAKAWAQRCTAELPLDGEFEARTLAACELLLRSMQMEMIAEMGETLREWDGSTTFSQYRHEWPLMRPTCLSLANWLLEQEEQR